MSCVKPRRRRKHYYANLAANDKNGFCSHIFISLFFYAKINPIFFYNQGVNF